jgi:hypothetical protein
MDFEEDVVVEPFHPQAMRPWENVASGCTIGMKQRLAEGLFERSLWDSAIPFG